MADEPTQPQNPDAQPLLEAGPLPEAGALLEAGPLPAVDTALPEPGPQPEADSAPVVPAFGFSSESELGAEPERPRKARRSRADAALPWVLGAVVVLLLAASGGLISAWIVATMRAVPAPPVAEVSPSPSPAASAVVTAEPTPAASDQPRHTPTPSAIATQEPAPFIHVVQRGEYLTYIADLYGVKVEDIVALNDIRNPNRIHPGQELLIPGYGHRPSPSPG